MAKNRTAVAFTEALPQLLRERELSLRALAQIVGVGDDHLSRVITGARDKRPTVNLIRRVSAALKLPEDFFPEARMAFVVEALAADPVIRDRVYDQLQRQLTQAKQASETQGSATAGHQRGEA